MLRRGVNGRRPVFFSMTPAVIGGSSLVKESEMCHSGCLWWRVVAGVGMCCLCVGWVEAVLLRRWLTLTLCHQYHSARTSHAGSPLIMALFFNVVVIVTVSFTHRAFSNQTVLEMNSDAGPEGIWVEASFASAERDAHAWKVRLFHPITWLSITGQSAASSRGCWVKKWAGVKTFPSVQTDACLSHLIAHGLLGTARILCVCICVFVRTLHAWCNSPVCVAEQMADVKPLLNSSE